MSIKILLADDHKIMRHGLRSLLEKEPGIEVVAEADNGQMAVRLTRKELPDVVIMDIAMQNLNGIEATRQIASDTPGVKVLALSIHSDTQFVVEMLQAGASGYLLKDCEFEELIRAINTVVSNKTYLSPEIADIVIENYIRNPPSKTVSSVFSVLTTREREVLQLLAEGKTNRQIASLLCLSIKTIETHRRQIMEKLKMQSLADLIKYAIRQGLTSLDH